MWWRKNDGDLLIEWKKYGDFCWMTWDLLDWNFGQMISNNTLPRADGLLSWFGHGITWTTKKTTYPILVNYLVHRVPQNWLLIIPIYNRKVKSLTYTKYQVFFVAHTRDHLTTYRLMTADTGQQDETKGSKGCEKKWPTCDQPQQSSWEPKGTPQCHPPKKEGLIKGLLTLNHWFPLIRPY